MPHDAGQLQFVIKKLMSTWHFWSHSVGEEMVAMQLISEATAFLQMLV